MGVFLERLVSHPAFGIRNQCIDWLGEDGIRGLVNR